MTQQDNRGGCIAAIQARPQWQRVAIFFTFVVVIVLFFFSLTAVLFYQSARSVPRSQPVAIFEDQVTVSEYTTFDEVDAYPSAVAVAPDGTLYTASFASGALWSIDAGGNVVEIPGSRQQIGAVSGLDVAADGTLYVLDRLHPLQAQGAVIWQIRDDQIREVVRFAAEGNQSMAVPNDLVVDGHQMLYAVDLQQGTIWQIDGTSGDTQQWWQPPDEPVAAAGLAYDAANERLLIADALRNHIYAVPINAENPRAETRFIYRHDRDDNPGFNGITLDKAGTVYVAALGMNQIMRVDQSANRLIALAGSFRGSSDVAYDAANERLFVPNWDQRWLLPVRFLFLTYDIQPRLPFSVDVVELLG